MTGMRIDVREIACPDCGALLDLGDAQTHPNEAALLDYLEAKVAAHIERCAPARARVAADALAHGEAST